MTTTTLTHRRRITCDQHSRYTAGCAGCQKRSADRARLRHRLIAYGTWRGMVDAQPARQRVTELIDAGWSRRRIAATAGVGRSVIDNLAGGQLTEMHAHTADAVLRLSAAPYQASGYDRVDATGAARRLQALTALGHPVAKLAAELGVNGQAVRRWRRRMYPAIGAAHNEAIRGLYERLSHIPGGCERTRNEAARNGWLSPLAWDGDSIDDPNARPDLGDSDAEVIDEIAVERALAGEHITLTRAERDHAFAVGLDRGWSVARIAGRLHMAGGYAHTIAARVRANQSA